MRYRVLQILRQTNGFISGRSIGESLNISRAAVWKHIKALEQEGVVIEAVSNKGYRLEKSPDIMCAELLSPLLNTRYLGRSASFLASFPSSNTAVKNLAQKGEKSGAIVVVENQTGGRGRRGRSWTNTKGLDICFSILLKPEIQTQYAPRYTIATALGVNKALNSFGIGSNVKWPNDVQINGRKLCGILLELNGDVERLEYLVIGIGLNVNTSKFAPELSKSASSMKAEAGREFERIEVLACIINELEPLYDDCQSGEGFARILNEYRQVCDTLGKTIMLSTIDGSIKVKAEDVDDLGHLIITDEHNNTRIVAAGDVSIARGGV